MRVLFCALPQLTHFFGMVPLAWALRTAGHEVRFAGQPAFTDAITNAGLTAVPVGGDSVPDPDEGTPEYQQALNELRRGLPKPYNIAEQLPGEVIWTTEMQDSYDMMVTYAFGEDNSPTIAGLVDFARSWQPDLVIWEPFTYAGAIAAKACGAAHARMLFGTDFLGITHEWIHRHIADNQLVNWLTSTSREYGLPFSTDMISGHFTINQLPRSLRVISDDLHYLPVQYIPYGGQAEVPDWLQSAPSERPRVALSLGTSATDNYSGYTVSVQDILDSLSDLDIELVATIAESEQEKLTNIPDNARIVSYVPLDALASTCSAAIQHGGFGTLTTFARHAVPQLTLPYEYDAPLLGETIAKQGAGISWYSDLAIGPKVRESLLRLLNEPTFRERATALRDEIYAMPTPNQLVHELEELTTKHNTAIR